MGNKLVDARRIDTWALARLPPSKNCPRPSTASLKHENTIMTAKYRIVRKETCKCLNNKYTSSVRVKNLGFLGFVVALSESEEMLHDRNLTCKYLK